MKRINNCSICKKKFLKIIDLGLHPCADTFLDSEYKANLLPRFPLQVGFCSCFHFAASFFKPSYAKSAELQKIVISPEIISKPAQKN